MSCVFNGELGVDVNCSQTHHKTVSMCHEKEQHQYSKNHILAENQAPE